MTKPPGMKGDLHLSIESEALAWIAQLDGDNISPKDLAAFKEWMGRSPAHAREIRELNSLWGELNILTDMVEPIAVTDAVSRQLRRRERYKSWRRRLALPAAAFAALVVISVSINHHQLVNESQVVETAEINLPTIFRTQIGERQEHILSDGSKITLNTGSQVEVDFQRDQRRVRLLEGEVLFDVAHDKARPFLVYAGDGIVRAVGTSFVVHLQGGDFDVIVSEGAVELSSVLPTPVNKQNNSPVRKIASLGIVEAGHKAKYENAAASVATLNDVEMSAQMSWRNGLITFTGETLEEVILEVSRYTELDIKFEDESLKGLKVGGVFRSGDTEGVFSNLKANFDIDVQEKHPGSVVLVKAP